MCLLKRLLMPLIGSILIFLPLVAISQDLAVITGRTDNHRLQKVSLAWWQDGNFVPVTIFNEVSVADSFNFHITLPVNKPVFFYLDGGSDVVLLGLIMGGDSIYILKQNDSLLVSGKGARVNTAMYLAQRLQDRVALQKGRVENQLEAAGLQLAIAKQILLQYKDSLSPSVSMLMKAHLMGGPMQQLTGILWQLPPAPDSTLEERQVTFYREKILPLLPDVEINDITVMSTRFSNYLIQKAEADFYIQHRFECNTKAVYEWVKQHYGGKVRDKLLAQALMQGYASGNQPEDQDWCVRDFLGMVQDSSCKQAIARIYGKSRKGLSRGNQAPSFNITDPTGKNVSLQQFLGKVVLLHFYDSKDPVLPALQEIKSCFKDTEVCFLNIGNGAMEAGFTGLQLVLNEATRAVLSQYEVNRYPSLIVVGKDGKIFAVKPPDPATDHGTALTNIIYEALLQ
ncbi:hypothetical protein DVR12_15795 [Chitinophaga silvatica]|uniref:Uncharacterized protein n=1 Tax=Chitinophaga silvatica TaxID=2282649 RepID=A0A3E1Y826_9BACT|nr:redoxin domain-containing protein [Chitinophaga silvatica]RFS21362.1 hypothetical protein DVR12_15795 [Chitinophaga silvatica]